MGEERVVVIRPGHGDDRLGGGKSAPARALCGLLTLSRDRAPRHCTVGSVGPRPRSFPLSSIPEGLFPTARLQISKGRGYHYRQAVREVIRGHLEGSTTGVILSRATFQTAMSTRYAGEDFEFLLDLLASDGVDADPQPLGAIGSRKGDDEDDRAGSGIQRGPDGKLDLGQVKAFYENKNTRAGKGKGTTGVRTGRRGVEMTGDPGLSDHLRDHAGLYNRSFCLNLELLSAR